MRSRFTFNAFCWFLFVLRVALNLHERRPG